MLKPQVHCLILLLSICSGNRVYSTHSNRIEALPLPSHDDLVKAADIGVDLIEKLERQELSIMHSRIKVHNGSISHGLLLENYPTPLSVKENVIANMILKATEYLANNNCKKHGLNTSFCGKYASGHGIPKDTVLYDLCQSQLRNTTTSNGRRINSYRRLLPPDYHDGLHKVRKSVTGHELPNPRFVTASLYSSNDGVTTAHTTDNFRTIAVAQFSQFIEQDLARTIQSTMTTTGRHIQCCDDHHRVAPPRSLHPFCDPIHIPSNDTFYHSHDVTCLNYVHSAIAVNHQCRFGSIEQINHASNKFDLSQLYGVTHLEKNNVRKFSKGKLRSVNGKLLPFADHPEKFCTFINSTKKCFASGDPRVNSNPYSSALHTVFLRHHNRLASEFHKINPEWDDQTIFVMAKKLNVMLYQRIIYEEWAPVVVGKEKARELLENTSNNPNLNRTNQVSNEFGTVGIRFYNTMLPEHLILRDLSKKKRKGNSSYNKKFEHKLFKLQDVQYKPKPVNPDAIMLAATRNKAMALDNYYVDDLSNHLYHSSLSEFGADALALDIQRSRDHGLPSYLTYLQKFIDAQVATWDDLLKYIDEKDVTVLRRIYKSVHDVDLIVGALAERPAKDAVVGPTLQYIIVEQLSNSRDNDENFYAHNLETGTQFEQTITENFAPALLCDTTMLSFVQKNIFKIPTASNPMLDCRDQNLFPKMKLNFDNLVQSIKS